ncbi:universal stress protein [Herbaspirillum seropedicae]|uniref:universal stress protein n=1 Tax=Herbaspirillum seropedicae TaxID=964 RepID=UPI003D976C5D
MKTLFPLGDQAMSIFKKILVPTDGSDASERAVQAAVQFAKESGSSLVGLSVAEDIVQWAVIDGTAINYLQVENEILENAKSNVARLAALAKSADVPCETFTVKAVHPYEEILAHASRQHCDAIFMASHGRKGLERFILGSQTQKVLANATIPVLVFR